LSWPYFVACRPTHTHIGLWGAITRQFIWYVRVRLIGYLHFQRFIFQLFKKKHWLKSFILINCSCSCSSEWILQNKYTLVKVVKSVQFIENQEQINEKLWEVGPILLKTNREDAFEYYYRSNSPTASTLGLHAMWWEIVFALFRHSFSLIKNR
jgi:tRNA A22 N-methylase